MSSQDPTYTILIASYLEPEHVERIRQVDQRVRIVYRPDLLRPPRYAADHVGEPVLRTAAQEAEWRDLLAEADILFDFDYTNLAELPELTPRLRWIQASSAGIGQLVRRLAYAERMSNVIFTTASGVHARPLAEYCLLAMLMFSNNLGEIQEQQSRRHWARLAGTDLAGRSLGIIGMGKIGVEVAKFAQMLDMKVIGAKRHVKDNDPTSLYLDELVGPAHLDRLLAQAQFLVLCMPHTDETEKIIGAREIALLPQGSVLINIARGAVVDEPALIAALYSGHLGGAALDVFEQEPLDSDSPLWEMPNVLVSPHSASTSDRENLRLTDLFCANLDRFLAGDRLQNVLDPEELY